MPIFTIPTSLQNQASSGGSRSYPAIAAANQYITIIDEFNRETLNPTNAYQMYAHGANAGTGDATCGNNADSVVLATSNASNDDCYLRTSQNSFARALYSINAGQLDNRSEINFWFGFSLQANVSTSYKGFLGVCNAPGALSAAPTTQIHAGISWDTSVDTKIYLDHGDGTTQTKTDSGITLPQNPSLILNVDWKSNSVVVINLYDANNNLLKSYTSTAFVVNADQTVMPYWYVKTLTTAIRNLTLWEWGAKAT